MAILRRRSSATPIDIEIQLDRSTTYVAGDQISGTVYIKSSDSLDFTDLDIQLLGSSRTSVERIAPTARDACFHEAFQLLLRLYPHNAICLPPNNVLLAQQEYAFPFVFIVPHTLQQHVCRHSVSNKSVHMAHSSLPPSLGDRTMMRELDIPDDLSPNNASIRYGIYVRISSNVDFGDTKTVAVLATKAKRLRILPGPATENMLMETPADHSLHQHQVLKTKAFSKLGTMSMVADHIEAFQIPTPQSRRKQTTSPFFSLDLRFYPKKENDSPPKLHKLITILESATFYSSSSRDYFPSKERVGNDYSQDVHTQHHVLDRRDLSGTKWTKIDAESASSYLEHDATSIRTSKSLKGRVHYSARIEFNLDLPEHTSFVPSFHSCLISRIYSVNFRLGLHGTGIQSRTIAFSMPAVISCGESDRPPQYSETVSGRWTDQRQVYPTSSQRHDSVVSYGNFGARSEELPTYS